MDVFFHRARDTLLQTLQKVPFFLFMFVISYLSGASTLLPYTVVCLYTPFIYIILGKLTQMIVIATDNLNHVYQILIE